MSEQTFSRLLTGRVHCDRGGRHYGRCGRALAKRAHRSRSSVKAGDLEPAAEVIRAAAGGSGLAADVREFAESRCGRGDRERSAH